MVAVAVVLTGAVSGAAVSTGATAEAPLAAADDALSELMPSLDKVAAPARAECAMDLFVVDPALLDDVELCSELLAEALFAPDPAPVSA
ncbi:hypothetical protein BOH72_24350 [Mycobacterium sp. WY10]|nr:hypothetical protein BOH72_24350 [Mycobacterium sp. WY10]